MSVPASIDKFPEFIRSQNYAFLREKSIDYIRQLAAEKWTDHNIHDPGITCMEICCYAITDLGYKTDFAIEDILSESSLIDFKTRFAPENISPAEDTFFTPREILPCNPLTLMDWRKLMIDVPLIRNAWLIPSDESQPEIYRDIKASKLTYTPNNHTQRLNLDGLFEINLEFEEDKRLGDLNTWEYQFALTSSDLKFVTLYFKPAWQVFFENDLNPEEFDHAYLGSFTSIEDTAFYQGTFYLQKGSLAIPFTITIESPLEKTDANKVFLDTRITAELNEIRAFLHERLNICLSTVTQLESKVLQHRNLCEDLVRFNQSEVEEISICTDIEVSADADIELVLAQIYFELESFLTPNIPFYSLEEMISSGVRLDEIFNGPTLQHGFVKEEDLAAADYKSVIHVSDIIQRLLDIKGIVAIKTIQLSKYFYGLVVNSGESWCLQVSPNRSLKFNRQNSKIVFYKGLIPYKAHKNETLKILEDLKAVKYRSRLQVKAYDLAIPQGINQSIKEFHSIQNEFPLVYGIGEEGLAPSSSSKRKAQAKQLKAFLSLFDQIMSNYCAQLANVRYLFSLNPDIKKTYFSQLLFSLPESYQITEHQLNQLLASGWSNADVEKLEPLLLQPDLDQLAFTTLLESLLGTTSFNEHSEELLELARIPSVPVPDLPHGENLLREFVQMNQSKTIDWDKPATFSSEWDLYLIGKKQAYWRNLCKRDPLIETSETYIERKNRFLDHLLARFAEKFTDYVLLSANINGAKTADDLILDKIRFLQDYPRLSRDRGKGFNYKIFDDPDNITGLELRASRLVGIQNWRRAPLATELTEIFDIFEETDTDSIDEWRFRLRDRDNHILFSSTHHYLDQDSLYNAMQETLECGIDRTQYKIKENKNHRYYFVLYAKDHSILVRRRKYYATQFEVESIILQIIETLKYRALRLEGFHLVEHILLRPVSTASHLFKVSLKTDCSPGYQDPYSFRATAVVPYWPTRFQNMDFRRFFEETLRREAPAHVHLKICWVDKETMAEFETLFFHWLKLKTGRIHTLPVFLADNQELIEQQNKLLHILENLNSIYPETHLFDCTKEGDSQSILLNHSKLGSNKGN